MGEGVNCDLLAVDVGNTVTKFGVFAEGEPMIELRAPERVIGRSTRAAMQSGVVLGEAARIDGLLDAVMGELGCEAPVVLTGDGALQVSALIAHDATVDEALTLRGLWHIWRANRRT